MPHASTFTRTCSGPGSGTSRSTNSQFPPGLWICAACIHACHSHRHRCDCVRVDRAACANARGLLGCDRNIGRDAIRSRRDADALDRADRRYRGGRVSRSARGQFFGANLVTFAVAIVFIGLLSIAFRLEKTAYRYASITLAIIVLIPRSAPAWIIALHRFLEVSVGIIVALAVVALWPEHQPTAAQSAEERRN